MINHIEQLLTGEAVHIPEYDFTNHRRTKKTRIVEPSPIILIDGILIFTNADLRDLMDIKVYVDTESDVRFIRRLERDMAERGSTILVFSVRRWFVKSYFGM